MLAAEISRAAARVSSGLRYDEVLAFASAVAGARSIEDVPVRWRGRIQEAHAALLSEAGSSASR